MRKLALVLSLVSLVLGGCPSDDGGDGDGENGGTCSACEVSSNCSVGNVCIEGCCAPFEGCTPDSCAAGEFCDADLECKTIEEKCLTAAAGCECHVVNNSGQLAASGAPTISMPAGATYEIRAILAESGGTPLPTTTAPELSVAGDLFTTSGNSVTAAAGAGGDAELTASFGSFAECTANLKNLGDGPTGNAVRVYVFNELTNQPIASATVIVDTDGDGIDDGGAGTTDANGLATTGDLGADANYDVTVFAQNYNYLSVAGLSLAAGGDIAIPMSERPAEPQTGGFTGRLNFTDYEDRYLGGRPAAVKFGVVAGSIPLKWLTNFNLDLLIGDITDADCEATPEAPGCYRIQIGGDLVNTTVALPGGVVVGLAATAIKEHFDSVSLPGRRYAWGLGGEVEIADLSGVINIVTPYVSGCTCNTTEGVCDSDDSGNECSCDLDCGLNIDIGAIFDDVMPLISNLATSAKGNIPLQSAPQSEWNDNITGAYLTRPSNAKFPKLDDGSGEYGQLVLREGWSNFTAVAAPALPEDPYLEGGGKMEAMLALTGVRAPGFGFVPLGMGIALDCTKGDCLNRDEGEFNGVINGGLMCDYSPDPADNRCSETILGVTDQGMLADGKLGVFHAPAFAGLEGQQNEQQTMLIAAPLSELMGDSTIIRATGVMKRGAFKSGSDSSFSGSFPGPAGQPTSLVGRTYAPTDSGHEVHFVTMATSTSEAALTSRWNVYFGDSPSPFTAPALPAGFAGDPFAKETEAGMDIEQNHVSSTHMGLAASGVTLSNLVLNDGSSLVNIFDAMDGFSIVTRNIPVEE